MVGNIIHIYHIWVVSRIISSETKKNIHLFSIFFLLHFFVSMKKTKMFVIRLMDDDDDDNDNNGNI